MTFYQGHLRWLYMITTATVATNLVIATTILAAATTTITSATTISIVTITPVYVIHVEAVDTCPTISMDAVVDTLMVM